ncbi:hypothetical protein [Phaeobacter sp.]|uniref:hypothetical protein n=1 Tax=Phaeobacter sp. TaxID=1902409 RepID=UPI0025E7A043|nr:hypothetical protein [Phaeobacter sp.]
MIYPIVLAGSLHQTSLTQSPAAGSSHAALPSHLQPRGDGESPFQDLLRALHRNLTAPPTLVADHRDRAVSCRQLQDIGGVGQFVLEPTQGGSAGAICAAMTALQEWSSVTADDFVLVVQLCRGGAPAQDMTPLIQEGQQAASTGALVAAGTRRLGPMGHYGWLQLAPTSEAQGELHAVSRRFDAAPPLGSAPANFNGVCGSGCYLARWDVLQSALHAMGDAAVSLARKAVRSGLHHRGKVLLDQSAYRQLPDTRFERAVLPKLIDSGRLFALPLDRVGQAVDTHRTAWATDRVHEPSH